MGSGDRGLQTIHTVMHTTHIYTYTYIHTLKPIYNTHMHMHKHMFYY